MEEGRGGQKQLDEEQCKKERKTHAPDTVLILHKKKTQQGGGGTGKTPDAKEAVARSLRSKAGTAGWERGRRCAR
jgi:hypothetical protein